MYENHRNEEVAVQSDWLCTATNKGYLTSFKKITNPNVSPIGKRFGFECFGAGDRTRTGTLSPAVDFESTTSTNSITPAGVITLNCCRKMFGCRPVAVPDDRLGVNAFVARRPQPLAQVAVSATGGAPIAPHHTGRCNFDYHRIIHYLFQNSKENFTDFLIPI